MAAADVAVVGGGAAGLAAAWTLARAGAAVTVYERRAEPGGRMRTDVLDGARVDPGVQLIGSYYRETFRLAREAGAEDRLVPAPGRDALWRDGRARRITYGSVASMTVSGALPLRLKMRLARRYLPFLRRKAWSLDPAEPERAAAAGLDGESIAAWGEREMGRDFVELFAYPLLGAYYGSVPEETSAGLYHALANAGTDVRVHAVRGGVGALPGAVAAALESAGARLRTQTEVDAVEADGAGVAVRCAGETATHQAAVVAVPAPAARRLIRDSGPLRTWLDGVRMTPSAALALSLDRPVPADYFGLSFPRASGPGAAVVACCIQERKGAGLVPDGRGLLVAYPAPSISPEIEAASPEGVLDRLLPAVEAAFPGLGGWVSRAKVYRFPAGYTRFHPGYLTHLRGFDPAWLPPRLALAGDYLVAPTVEGAVRSGRRAAARILDSGVGSDGTA